MAYKELPTDVEVNLSLDLPQSEGMKQCVKKDCKTWHPKSSFTVDKSRPDGLGVYCPSCRKKKGDYYYKTRRENGKHRWAAIKNNYGLSQEGYEAMLKRQNDCCAICDSPSPGGHGKWHVDHNHSTGEVRGLLCNLCNSALGKFKDSPTILKAAAAYLERTSYYGD